MVFDGALCWCILHQLTANARADNELLLLRHNLMAVTLFYTINNLNLQTT